MQQQGFQILSSRSLRKINKHGATAEKSLLLSIPGGLSNACKPKMEQLPPPSVLDRLQSFLPALDKANAALAQQPAGVANLELEGSRICFPQSISLLLSPQNR